MIKLVIILSLGVASYFISFSDSAVLRYIVYGSASIGIGITLFSLLYANHRSGK